MSIKKVKKILKKRQKDYGNAEEAFARIGRMWGAILDLPDLQAYQVALMMDALKTIRLTNNPWHEDSWNDKLGYTIHGREIMGVDES